MREPAWKKLVAELRDAGHRSVYLDRLRDRVDVGQSQDELKREILREMASVLGRAEDRVNLALLRLELLDRELEAVGPAGDADAIDERVDAFNCQRRAALRALWELTVHREALGFRRNDVLREFYPVPPAKPRGGRG